MRTDHSATAGASEGGAASSVRGRQASLAEVVDGDGGATADDGAHQTTLGTHVEALEPGEPAGSEEGAPGVTYVNAFPMRDVLLVKHYFEGDGAFGVLEPYYDQREYRFEIPLDELPSVQEALADHGYELTVVDYLEPFAVVVRKYSHHPESVFEDAVAEFSSADFNVFVLSDEAAVETAVRSGAQRLAEAPVSVRFPTARGTGPLTVQDVTADGR